MLISARLDRPPGSRARMPLSTRCASCTAAGSTTRSTRRRLPRSSLVEQTPRQPALVLRVRRSPPHAECHRHGRQRRVVPRGQMARSRPSPTDHACLLAWFRRSPISPPLRSRLPVGFPVPSRRAVASLMSTMSFAAKRPSSTERTPTDRSELPRSSTSAAFAPSSTSERASRGVAERDPQRLGRDLVAASSRRRSGCPRPRPPRRPRWHLRGAHCTRPWGCPPP